MTESDKELLEYAAKAAGIEIFSYQEVGNKTGWPITDIGLWNPLLDDGDALRLSVNLQLTVCNEQLSSGVAYCTDTTEHDYPEVFVGSQYDSDVIPEDYEATRRAIVRAAAEIGKPIP